MLSPPPGSAAPGTGRCSAAGAGQRRRRRGRHGTTTSSRNTLVSGTACEVGGMPSAATSPTRATELEDHVELAGELVELLLGEGQPRQPGEVRDLLAGDWHAGHPRAPRVARRRAAAAVAIASLGGPLLHPAASRGRPAGHSGRPQRRQATAGRLGGPALVGRLARRLIRGYRHLTGRFRASFEQNGEPVLVQHRDAQRDGLVVLRARAARPTTTKSVFFDTEPVTLPPRLADRLGGLVAAEARRACR